MTIRPRPVWSGGPRDLAVHVHRHGATDEEVVEVMKDQIRRYLALHPPKMSPQARMRVSPELVESVANWTAWTLASQHGTESFTVTREALIYHLGYTWALNGRTN